MTGKVRMTMTEIAAHVHNTLVSQAQSMKRAGAPLEIISGELLKLAIRMMVHLRGKEAAQRDIQKLVDRCFEAIGPEAEAALMLRGDEHWH